MDNMQIFDIADRLKAAKDEKKDLDAKAKEVGTRIEELDKQLSDAMAEAELDKFSRNGFTFYLSSRLFASPQAGRKDALISALREEGYGDIVQETVNANTLASFVKEQKSQNKDTIPEWLDQVVSTYEKVSVGIRKG